MSRKYSKDKVEHITLIAGILQPLITLPQIVHIYSSQSAQDVSLLTWVGYLLFAFIFLGYGIIFHLRPIIVTQSIWIAMEIGVIMGVILYG